MRVYWIADHKLGLRKLSYAAGGGIALMLCMLSNDNKPTGEVWDTITVNLEDSDELEEDEVFARCRTGIDYRDWLITKGLGRPVQKVAKSGYCTYKAVRLCQDIMDLKEGEYL